VNLGFFCVADGIGGIQDGEHAGRLAVETACQSFARGWAHYGADEIIARPFAFAKTIAKVVGQRLALEGEFAPGTNRGGTTFSGIVIAGRRAGICHVGDSRVALIRKGKCYQLTDDHTLATILVRLGELTPEEAEKNDLSQRTISRFLSTSAEVETSRIDGLGRDLDLPGADPHGFEIQRGDLFVLTSDGSHGEFTEELLLEFVQEFDGDPQSLCDALVQNALDRMGRDNSTALAVLVE
jgi:protein phosphatase